MIDIERERQRHRRREKQAPRLEPDVGLDPGSPGSRPGPKAGAKPLHHPGIPTHSFQLHMKLSSEYNRYKKLISHPVYF